MSTMRLMLEVLIPFATGGSAILLIRQPLRDLLSELCGSHQRTTFWCRVLYLQLLGLPLLASLYFEHPDMTAGADEVLRRALLLSLSAVLLGLLFFTQRLLKMIPGNATTTGVPAKPIASGAAAVNGA